MYLGEGAGLREGKKKNPKQKKPKPNKKPGVGLFFFKTGVCLKICHPRVRNLFQNVPKTESTKW